MGNGFIALARTNSHHTSIGTGRMEGGHSSRGFWRRLYYQTKYFMKLVTWNDRGLNKAYKKKEVQRFIRENNISIIAIVERRVQEKYSSKILNK